MRLIVNGATHDVTAPAHETLVTTLRERLHLTGTKLVCGRGECGACTVLLDGVSVYSCLTLTAACTERAITTIEGIGRADDLHEVQAAFVEHDALQCGYCTPGQVCSAVALLDEAKAGAVSAATSDVRRRGPIELDEAEIRERMSGNLCRCGAYVNIVAAVRDASRRT